MSVYKSILGITITILITLSIWALTSTSTYGQEATSTNFGITTRNGQYLDQSSSANFGLPCSIAGFLEQSGVSSSNFSVTNLNPCPLATFQIQFKIAPEKRVQNVPPNWASTNVQFLVRFAGADPFDPVLYNSGDLGPTDNSGNSPILTITIPSLPSGYDLAIKTEQGLTRKIVGFALDANALNAVDFSQADTVFVKAGDAAGSTFGDNKVNSLDIGSTINVLNSAASRPDFNRDTLVNSLDIGILLANLNELGE